MTDIIDLAKRAIALCRDPSKCSDPEALAFVVQSMKQRVDQAEKALDDKRQGLLSMFIELREHAPECPIAAKLLARMQELKLAPSYVHEVTAPEGFIAVTQKRPEGVYVRAVELPTEELLAGPLGPYATDDLAEAALKAELIKNGIDVDKAVFTTPENFGKEVLKAAGLTPERLSQLADLAQAPAKGTVH